jgi:hypothetical protein
MRTVVVRFSRWFYPGLGVKRWLLVALIGCLLFVNGVWRWFVAEGPQVQVNEIIDTVVADLGLPLGWLSYAFMILGVYLIVWGIRQWMQAIVVAIDPGAKSSIVDALLDRRLRGGYKIVAIGGGTGLSTLAQTLHEQSHGGRYGHRRRRQFGPLAKRTRHPPAGRYPQLPRRTLRRRSARDRSLPIPLQRRRRAERSFVRQSVPRRHDERDRQLR